MPLTIYKRGDTYHFRGTIGPKDRRQNLRGSCFTTDKDIAARYAAEIEAKYWKGNFDGPSAILTFDQACVNYLAAGKHDEYLPKVQAHLGRYLVKDITPQVIQQMAVQLGPNLSNNTRNRHFITPARAVINHNAENGFCSHIRVRKFPSEESNKTPADMDWIDQFRRGAKPHLGTWALFMFLTGARPSEALAVQWSDIDLDRATALIRQTKTSTERVAHLPAMLVNELRQLRRWKGKPVFRYTGLKNAHEAWRNRLDQLTIERLSPHCCRHGFATELLRRGVDVHTVAWLGGWAKPAVVLSTYGHAMKKRNLTDMLVSTPQAQGPDEAAASASKLLAFRR